MPRNASRGRGAPDGGSTGGNAGSGWFVVGYGMDYQERFRNLPDIRLFNPEETGKSD